jgi:hypothetical protein
MENKATSCSSFGFYFFILAIGLGVTSHSFWVGLSAFFALAVLAQVWDQGTDLNYAGFYGASVFGLGLLTLTMYLCKFKPGYSWGAATLVSAALVFLGTGIFIVSRGSKFTGWLSILVALGITAYTFGLAQRWIQPGGAAAQKAVLVTLVQGFNLWGTLSAALGIILLLAARKQADDLEQDNYMILVILGLIALGVGSWLAHLRPMWEWIFFWELGTLIIFIGAQLLRQYIDFYPQGKIGQAIAAACFLFGLAGPLFLTGGFSFGQLPVAHVHWNAIWPFFWDLIRSGWGAVYLAILLVMAQMWVPRWGAVLMAVGLAGFAAWQGPDAALITSLQPVLTVNPVQAFIHLLGAQAEPNSAVWVPVIVAVVISILTMPLNRATLWKSRGFQEMLQKVGPAGGDTMARLMTENGMGCGWTLSWVLLMVIGLAIPISLWMALHRLTGSATLSFPLLGIPDLIRPDWKPVWDWHYFILPVVYAVAMYAANLVNRHYGLNNPFGNFWTCLISGAVFGLFVPAGVMIYLCAQTITQLLVVPVMFLGYKPTRAEPARPFESIFVPQTPSAPEPASAPAPAPTLPPARPAAAAASAVESTASVGKNPFGTLIEIFKNSIVDLLVTDQGEVFTVDDSGSICLNQEKDVKRIGNISRANMIGMVAGSDNRLVIVRSDGSVELVDRTPGSTAASTVFHTQKPVACFAVNPFGTKLVYAAPSEACVRELNLLNSKESLLCEHLSGVTTLAFSKDSQHLAVGLEDGSVDIINISSRSLAGSLVSNDGASGEVTHLAAGPASQWVVVYRNRAIACWNQFDNSEPENLIQSDLWITSLSVDSQSGKVACGCKGGMVVTYPLDLGAYDFRKPVFKSDVVKLAFLKGGETLVGIGASDPLVWMRP